MLGSDQGDSALINISFMGIQYRQEVNLVEPRDARFSSHRGVIRLYILILYIPHQPFR